MMNLKERADLVRQVRTTTRTHDIRMVRQGQGNDTRYKFFTPSGMVVGVLFPEDGRVGDWDEREMREVMAAIKSGEIR